MGARFRAVGRDTEISDVAEAGRGLATPRRESAPRRSEGGMTGHSGRFAITPARAVEDRRLGDAAYRLLACLGTYADKDGWCWPSMPTLADRLGITRQAVQRSIRQLAEIGYIEVEPRRRPDGSQDRNRYRLLF